MAVKNLWISAYCTTEQMYFHQYQMGTIEMLSNLDCMFQKAFFGVCIMYKAYTVAIRIEGLI